MAALDAHPFPLGSVVYARRDVALPGGTLLVAGSAVVVALRGLAESDGPPAPVRLWFAAMGRPGVMLWADDFTLRAPMPPATDAADDAETA